MSLLFWILAGSGYVGGLALAWLGTKRVVRRIGEHTPYRTHIVRAGTVSAAVALLPALFIATVIGGNLGGAVAAGLAEALFESLHVRRLVVGAGIGLGVMALLSGLVVTLAAAGAVFVKVFLARGRS